MPTSNAVLLPSNVQPASYAIHLTPDLVAFTFTGEESVAIEVLESTDTIVLNASELQVSEATLTPASGAAKTASGIAMDADEETLTLTFPDAISPGKGTLNIVFTGELNDRLTGFYRSQYTDSAGQSHTMATTQFEPGSARRSFPCWDEPALKATFQLTLTIPSDMDAVSNMPVAEESAAGAVKTMKFAESPIMSTYRLEASMGRIGSRNVGSPRNQPISPT